MKSLFLGVLGGWMMGIMDPQRAFYEDECLATNFGGFGESIF